MPRADDSIDSTVIVPNVPVARLPPEILILIFSILTIIQPLPEESTNVKHYRHIGWLKVTQVCRRWRNIAFNQPILWASNVALPSVMGDLWAAAFLTRAKNVPLTVNSYGNPFTKDPESDIPFIGANLAQTSAIMNLHTHHHHLHALCTPAPLLHTLRLNIYHRRKAASSSSPRRLFGGVAGLPNLRHLYLAARELRLWKPLLLEQLVSVDITIFDRQYHGAALASILAALGRMRGLERLSLMLHLEDADGVPTTMLPALQHLNLRLGVQDARLLLPHLALPADVRVHFTAVLHEYASELSTIFPAMMACFDTPIARIAVQQDTPDKEFPWSMNFAEVAAWHSGDTEGAPALVARFEEWEDVPSVLGSLPSTHLEVLTIGGDVCDAAWLDLLGSAPRLRHVTVKGEAVPSFCAAFERAPGVLPALSTLVVNVHGRPRARSILMDALPRFFVARNALRELEVVGCDEDEACARALRETVPSLVIRWRKATPEEEGEVYEEEGDEEEEDATISDSDVSELEDGA
ncbi:hypothetical protein FA95DRAFT_1600201 [Auriscalpium vulgare]|uniref:Uncharacterized protein n=1 Tax=Auriscalpium vulgare TaxID=40419 RepID=A0ACB8R1W0_9AGAM|nr:hypothetical protein FA95DRAFT_1600201 [Auriscalpium vulgare]